MFIFPTENISFREGNPLCAGCKMPDSVAKAIYKVHFKTSKISADEDLKNHYISSKKTSINNGKNTYKSRFVTIRKSISYKVVT